MQKKILIIAAHPDDEVLGCGGTIAKKIAQGHQVRLCILSSGEGARDVDNTSQKNESLENVKDLFGIEKVYQFNFKDNQFDTHSLLDIIKALESVSDDYRPEIVYTHSQFDLNIDHRITNQATLTAFRPLPSSSVEKILAYEVLSSTELATSGSFKPNYFESLNSENVAKKLAAMKLYIGEMRDFPHPRSLKTIESHLITRGSFVGVNYAESFIIEREICKN